MYVIYVIYAVIAGIFQFPRLVYLLARFVIGKVPALAERISRGEGEAERAEETKVVYAVVG